MTTQNPMMTASAHHAASLESAIRENATRKVMLRNGYLRRQSRGENGHVQYAEKLETTLAEAADHVESEISSTQNEDLQSYISDLCHSARFCAQMLRLDTLQAVTSRKLTKGQFNELMIELISSWNFTARHVMLELREIESAAKRKKKTRSAVILPFQPRSI